ncbi:probable WRKY transcription factor protein 1 [Teleopsis dalmanni]|uniref:probable WRKY transcription factor protein 1 n=1 Tax=Teleopsis dalmanni TaxID=139649 RepID=UPI0018CEBB28|nr:probable WRKY transcription factor protein 1 [Teleopsis dalmanni]
MGRIDGEYFTVSTTLVCVNHQQQNQQTSLPSTTHMQKIRQQHQHINSNNNINKGNHQQIHHQYNHQPRMAAAQQVQSQTHIRHPTHHAHPQQQQQQLPQQQQQHGQYRMPNINNVNINKQPISNSNSQNHIQHTQPQPQPQPQYYTGNKPRFNNNNANNYTGQKQFSQNQYRFGKQRSQMASTSAEAPLGVAKMPNKKPDIPSTVNNNNNIIITPDATSSTAVVDCSETPNTAEDLQKTQEKIIVEEPQQQQPTQQQSPPPPTDNSDESNKENISLEGNQEPQNNNNINFTNNNHSNNNIINSNNINILSDDDTSPAKNSKEKTPMCLVNELARFNKLLLAAACAFCHISATAATSWKDNGYGRNNGEIMVQQKQLQQLKQENRNNVQQLNEQWGSSLQQQEQQEQQQQQQRQQLQLQQPEKEQQIKEQYHYDEHADPYDLANLWRLRQIYEYFNNELGNNINKYNYEHQRLQQLQHQQQQQQQQHVDDDNYGNNINSNGNPSSGSSNNNKDGIDNDSNSDNVYNECNYSNNIGKHTQNTPICARNGVIVRTAKSHQDARNGFRLQLSASNEYVSNSASNNNNNNDNNNSNSNNYSNNNSDILVDSDSNINSSSDNANHYVNTHNDINSNSNNNNQNGEYVHSISTRSKSADALNSLLLPSVSEYEPNENELEVDLPYGIQNVRKRRIRGSPSYEHRGKGITYQSLCPTKRISIPLETLGYEYRPNHYIEVTCAHNYSPVYNHDFNKNRICSEAGFSCIQLNRTIHLIRRNKVSSMECWESEIRIVPSGCECMWPKHNYGDIVTYHDAEKRFDPLANVEPNADYQVGEGFMQIPRQIELVGLDGTRREETDGIGFEAYEVN